MIYVTTLYGQIIKKERVHMKEQQTGTIEIPLQERYMISLKEASAYFHIGIKKMRRMAEDNEGGFALFLGNRYLICRPKFEEYLLKVMENSRTEQEMCDEEISH